MDYQEELGFTADETVCWAVLKVDRRRNLANAVLLIVFPNIAISILLIAGASTGRYWMVYIGLVWILTLTTKAIEKVIRERDASVHFRSLAEKIEKRISQEPGQSRGLP